MSDKNIDITVVGSIFMDLICYADRLPRPGETIGGTDFQAGYGGKGANQCVAAQRLGSKCAMVGKVGQDAYGKEYFQHFTDEGVDTSGILKEGGVPTGVASIMVGNDNGENVIIIVNGATSRVTAEYVEKTGEDLISRSKVVVCQLEIPIPTVRTALRLAKKHGAITIFNAAPGSTDISSEIFQLTDILCVNETEAEMISGRKAATVGEAKDAIEVLTKKFGCKTVIVTLGPDGAVVWDHDTQSYSHYAAPIVKAVDSTGAGDCFVGTLAHCVAKSLPLKDAIEKSIMTASDSVTRKGTQSSYPKTMVA